MLTEPKIVERSETFYAGIGATVTMGDFPRHADTLFPELMRWVAQRGLAIAAAPFIKYNRIDMEHGLDVEFAVPLERAAAGDGRVETASLPAGRYASITHFGGFDGLAGATAALLDWARGQGLHFAVDGNPDGDVWASRIEIYHTDPRSEPDRSRWETEIAIKLA